MNNVHRITYAQWEREHGDITDYTDECSIPALCDEGCEVELDGTCEHKCPSPLVAMGMI